MDHEPPLRVVTRLAEDGIIWRKGETIQTHLPFSGEIDPVTALDRGCPPSRGSPPLEVETIVDCEALDHGQFQAEGGFQRLNKIFNDQLDQILHEITEAVLSVAA